MKACLDQRWMAWQSAVAAAAGATANSWMLPLKLSPHTALCCFQCFLGLEFSYALPTVGCSSPPYSPTGLEQGCLHQEPQITLHHPPQVEEHQPLQHHAPARQPGRCLQGFVGNAKDPMWQFSAHFCCPGRVLSHDAADRAPSKE
eukprot:1155522-Pelagomonas_calceolata.AAC.6